MESFWERRRKAGVLLSYIGEMEDRKTAEKALRIYKAWVADKITYREALARIRKLAGSGRR